MKKANIISRYDRGHYLPAINVKCYDFGPTADATMQRFGCSREDAERALQFAFESAQKVFWEEFSGDIVPDIFPGSKCYSYGRSGGWLVVSGLPDIETWNAIAVGKWAKLCRMVREEIKYLGSDDFVFELIEANQWAKPRSERYNFVGDGRCIADIKREAIAAGYGPVVRV